MIPCHKLAKIRELRANGYRVNRISRETGCSQATVKKYIADMDDVEIRPTVKPEIVKAVEDYNASPDNISVIAERHGINYATLWKHLKKAGLFVKHDRTRRKPNRSLHQWKIARLIFMGAHGGNCAAIARMEKVSRESVSQIKEMMKATGWDV